MVNKEGDNLAGIEYGSTGTTADKAKFYESKLLRTEERKENRRLALFFRSLTTAKSSFVVNSGIHRSVLYGSWSECWIKLTRITSPFFQQLVPQKLLYKMSSKIWNHRICEVGTLKESQA